MSQSGFNRRPTFPAAANLDQFSLVTLNGSGQIAAAGQGDSPIGVVMESVLSGESAAVWPLTEPGSFIGVASAAITVGTVVNPAAGGKVAADDTSAKVAFQAVNASGGDGEQIELIRLVGTVAST